jgi:hypothetical protein
MNLENTPVEAFVVRTHCRHARTLSIIASKGYQSVRKFSDMHNLNYNEVNAIIGMRRAPFTKNGKLRKVAKDTAEALKMDPVDLWGGLADKVYSEANPKKLFVQNIKDHPVAYPYACGALTQEAPDEILMGKETKEVIADRMEALMVGRSNMFKDSVRMYYGLPPYEHSETLQKIAVKHGRSRARIGQMALIAKNTYLRTEWDTRRTLLDKDITCETKGK